MTSKESLIANLIQSKLICKLIWILMRLVALDHKTYPKVGAWIYLGGMEKCT